MDVFPGVGRCSGVMTLKGLLFVTLAWLAWTTPALASDPTGLESPLAVERGEMVLTIIGTNDIHGGVNPSERDGQVLGGFDWFAGYVAAVRTHVNQTYGERGQTLLLDAGDAAQGTLLSNYSEGLLVAKLMNNLGYTAAIPGNHAYDFGPVGWRDDKVSPDTKDQDCRGALARFIKSVTFPLLAANLTTRDGQRIPGLPPFVLVPTLGRRNVCIIGLESAFTPSTTTAENVADLRFTDGKEELRHIVEDLWTSGKADVFIAVMHHGDGMDKALGSFLAELPRRSTGEPLVDAVVAGHTHFVNDAVAGGIPYVQSGANGRMFGLLQLVMKTNPTTRRLFVDRTQTRRKAGIPIVPAASEFLGQAVAQDVDVKALIDEGNREVKDMAERVLVTLPEALDYKGGRLQDSPMGNFFADRMREAAMTDIAMINSGGVRSGLAAGAVTYTQFFGVIPFNNRMMIAPKVPIELLARNIETSIQTCGNKGALQFSGITVEFERDCDRAVDGADPKGRLLKITTTDGHVLYELRDGKPWTDSRTVSVATVDFMMEGGAGYKHFKGLSTLPDASVLRDAVANRMSQMKLVDPSTYSVGRYINRLVPGATTTTPR